MFLLTIILIFLWLEIVATTLPLFLTGLLILLISRKKVGFFVLAFLGGLILDASAVHYLGGASLFLICWLFLILLYERKYEINTVPFVFVSSFFGTFLYLWLFGYGDIFIQSIVGSFLSGALFIIFRRKSTSYKENLRFNSI